jgi:hypothetical protein
LCSHQRAWVQGVRVFVGAQCYPSFYLSH